MRMRDDGRGDILAGTISAVRVCKGIFQPRSRRRVSLSFARRPWASYLGCEKVSRRARERRHLHGLCLQRYLSTLKKVQTQCSPARRAAW